MQLNMKRTVVDSEEANCIFEGGRLHDHTQMHDYPARKGAIRLDTYRTLC
jgi:hypothetical protein